MTHLKALLLAVLANMGLHGIAAAQAPGAKEKAKPMIVKKAKVPVPERVAVCVSSTTAASYPPDDGSGDLTAAQIRWLVKDGERVAACQKSQKDKENAKEAAQQAVIDRKLRAQRAQQEQAMQMELAARKDVCAKETARWGLETFGIHDGKMTREQRRALENYFLSCMRPLPSER